MNTGAIRQWVADTTRLNTIWIPTNAPRPPRPYASIQVISSPRIHRAVYGKPNEEGEASVTSDVEVTLTINVYESSNALDPRSAFDKCQSLRDSLELISVRQGLKDQGWAFRAVELLTDTPQLVDTKWEPRATFDVRFGTTVDQTDDLGLIETATVTGSVRDTDFETTTDLEV